MKNRENLLKKFKANKEEILEKLAARIVEQDSESEYYCATCESYECPCSENRKWALEDEEFEWLKSLKIEEQFEIAQEYDIL